MLFSHAEQLAHHLRPVSEVLKRGKTLPGESTPHAHLLNELRADDAQEGGRCLIGNGLREQRLARARTAVQDDTSNGRVVPSGQDYFINTQVTDLWEA